MSDDKSGIRKVQPVNESPDKKVKNDNGVKKDSNKKSKNPVKATSKSIGLGHRIAAFLKKLQAALKLANILSLLQTLAMTIVSVGSSLISIAASAIVSFATTVVATATAFVATIATTIGVSMGVAAVASVVAVTSVIGAGVSFVQSVVSQQEDVVLLYSDAQDNCDTIVKEAFADGEAPDPDEKMLENAQTIYSILSAAGIPDVNIAGVLSNFYAESGVDPTGVETIFDEPYYLGPKKKKAVEDIDDFTQHTVFPAYNGSGVTLNIPFYKASDGKYYCGVSLGYTGENAKNFLEAAEEVNEGEWWTAEFCIAYTFVFPAQELFSNGIGVWTEPEDDPVSAASRFARYWEGCSAPDLFARHLETANYWYEEMQSWEVDETVADSALALIEKLGVTSSEVTLGKALRQCKAYMNYDNSSIATAAISYAYATEAEGVGNDGTDLYVRVHDAVYPGDGWYQSCDRGASCAIKWCGADIEFPRGATSQQHEYLSTSDKWKEVDFNYHSYDDKEYAKLKPGDVFCTVGDGHIFLFVGKEMIAEMHGGAADEGSDIVSASFCERSPGCGFLGSDSRTYKVWRCVKPDNSDEYKDAGSGAKPASTLKVSSRNISDLFKKNKDEDADENADDELTAGKD